MCAKKYKMVHNIINNNQNLKTAQNSMNIWMGNWIHDYL